MNSEYNYQVDASQNFENFVYPYEKRASSINSKETANRCDEKSYFLNFCFCLFVLLMVSDGGCKRNLTIKRSIDIENENKK